MDILAQISDYFECEKDLLMKVDQHQISNVIRVLEQARIDNRRIFVMGNGGSAATASHFCCDFNRQTKKSGMGFKVICLNDNIPSMLAYANDLSFDDMFTQALSTLYEPGDVILGISTSGNSPNVINALRWGKMNGAITIALTGYNGGMCRNLVDYEINVPNDHVKKIEDIHLMINHCMSTILCGR
jgi:D-sedoheptulose 7-phosphate isomerase